MPETVSQPGGEGSERNPSGTPQSTDRTQGNFEPTQAEQDVVKAWLKRVERAEEKQDRKTWRDDLKRLRRYERGVQTVDDKKSRTNMIFATLAAQMPKLYAKNPAIAVQPTDAVGKDEMAKVKRFAETAEKVIRNMLVEEGKLKRRAKANIRSTCVTSFGALKVIYQKEYRGDPIAVKRIEDTQDNLARVEALVEQIKKEEDLSKLAEKRDALKANLQALSAGNEVSIFKGFTVDRMKSEDFLILDDNVDEFDKYVEADALGHPIWMTVGDARTLFNMEPKGATRYGRPRPENETKVDDTPADDQFICVIEIWDKKNGVVRTVAKGMNRWLREPYAPRNVPQRWYPFYLLGFNITEGEWRPLSDVEMLVGLQEEYDRTRQNYADAREKATPVLIFRKAGELTETDVKNITDRKNKDTIGVEGNPATPLTQDLMWFAGAPVDPAAYDVSLIRNEMDLVVGLADTGRANLIQPKTATEAELLAEAMQSRMSERRDTNEDMLSEMAEACLEVALRDLTLDEVKQIAGPEAEWPETPDSVDVIFRQVKVKVRAGSSGKPNQQKEREQWGQLLPVIKETMVGVAELRAAGNYDMAEAQIELVRETLRRYDENLDLDAIIPPTEKDENGKPLAHQQAAMELVQCKEQLQACQEELAKCQQELQKAQAGEQSKINQANLDSQAADAEAARKAAEAAAQAQRDHEAAQAEAARANALSIAQENAKAEQARIDEARAKREADAKLEIDKFLAIAKAATQLMAEKIKAKAAASAAQADAAAEGERQQAEAEQATATADELKGLVAELQKTMQGMSAAFEQLGKDSAERTALVKQHLAE